MGCGTSRPSGDQAVTTACGTTNGDHVLELRDDTPKDCGIALQASCNHVPELVVTRDGSGSLKEDAHGSNGSLSGREESIHPLLTSNKSLTNEYVASRDSRNIVIHGSMMPATTEDGESEGSRGKRDQPSLQQSPGTPVSKANASPPSPAMILPLSSPFPSPSPSLLPIGTNVPHNFSYEELEAATDGFSDERLLGQGGYGKVYDAWLDVPVMEEGDEGRAGAVQRVKSLASAGNSREGSLRGGINALLLNRTLQTIGGDAAAASAAAAVCRLPQEGVGWVEAQPHVNGLPESSDATAGSLGGKPRAEGRKDNEAENDINGSEAGLREASSDAALDNDVRGRQESTSRCNRLHVGSEAEQRGLEAKDRGSEVEQRASEAELSSSSPCKVDRVQLRDCGNPAGNDGGLLALPENLDSQITESQAHSLANSKRHKKVERRRVAVKKLEALALQGFNEWLAEILFLGRLQHLHLVRLVGYCEDHQHGLLVYEHMHHGSLDKHLFAQDKPPLSWQIRLDVAIGAAKGLEYMHSNSEHQVIFRDLKAGNILLDENFFPKLSDFGLAKDGPALGQTHVSTKVVGTLGYTAPEYVETGHLTSKSDVYAFGVLLLELLSGRRAIDMGRPFEERTLAVWARPYLKDPALSHHLVDPRVVDFPIFLARGLAAVARSCLLDASRRPSMSAVVASLRVMKQHLKQQFVRNVKA